MHKIFECITKLTSLKNYMYLFKTSINPFLPYYTNIPIYNKEYYGLPTTINKKITNMLLPFPPPPPKKHEKQIYMKQSVGQNPEESSML